MKIKKLLRVKFFQEYFTNFKEHGLKDVLSIGGLEDFILFLYVLFDKRFNIKCFFPLLLAKGFFF